MIISKLKKYRKKMKIRNLTEKQYQYLKKLVWYTNYKKCKDLKKLTIIQASYLIKKLEKEWTKILLNKHGCIRY